jgi:hypothetical protein
MLLSHLENIPNYHDGFRQRGDEKIPAQQTAILNLTDR